MFSGKEDESSLSSRITSLTKKNYYNRRFCECLLPCNNMAVVVAIIIALKKAAV